MKRRYTSKGKSNRTHWLNIRLTSEERQIILSRCQKTTCHGLSEYARKLLLQQKITVFYRNDSLDKFMEEMILLRKELNFVGNNFNQVVRKINSLQKQEDLNLWLPASKKLQEDMLRKTEAIKNRINQISEKWWQNS